jgi:hypothetical protein
MPRQPPSASGQTGFPYPTRQWRLREGQAVDLETDYRNPATMRASNTRPIRTNTYVQSRHGEPSRCARSDRSPLRPRAT